MEIKSSEQKRQHDSNGSTVHWTATLIRRWWLTLFIPIAVGIVSDTSLLMKYPQAVGLDGYYYVLQADSLRQTGHLLYSSSTPVLFYVLAVVSKITGDTVLAAKAVSIGFHVLLCAGLFVLLRVLSGRSWPGALAGLMAAICGLHVYLIVEFVKSLAALALFVWAVCFWLLAEKRAPSWRTRMVAGLCLVLAMLTHRAMWLVVAGIVLSVLITYLLQRETKKALSLAVLVLVACFLMPWCLASQTAFGLPCQMQTELLSHPATPLDNIGWPEKILVAFFAPAALFVARIYRAQIDPRLLSCLAAVGVLSILVTLNPFLDHGQGSLNVTGRLSNLAYLEAAVLVPGVFFVFARMGQRRILF
ncbi:MAG TPA: glycosyltransferase family 39 protein, partial [Clostridia bacterium]|nr:glycosyltransferase family 39 protein [Clostridia bacterium]